MKSRFFKAISRVMSLVMIVTGMQLPVLQVHAVSIPLTVDVSNENMKKIDGGWGFTLAITSDGRVAAWGDDTYGQCDVPLGLNNVVQVAAGQQHSLALKADGTVVAWGDNTYGQSSVPANLSEVVAISAGAAHSLALKSDGTVVSWGGFTPNDPGTLDVPDVLKNPATANIKAIAAGGYHSLALKTDGTVVAWGDDSQGQCSITDNLKDILTNVVAISAPWNHNLAVKSDGTVVAWGADFGQQLEIPGGQKGTYGTNSNFSFYYGLDNVVAVTGSVTNSMALKSDGTVISWGGFYPADYEPGMFTPPSDLSGVAAISSEDKGSAALLSDGTVTAWGQTAGHIPNGPVAPALRILSAQMAKDNSYIDVNFNTGVYGAADGVTPVSPSSFQLLFNSNGGDAVSTAINSVSQTAGGNVTGGETSVRFHLSLHGVPTGQETIEIKPMDGNSIFDVSGAKMDAAQTTRPVNLTASVQKIISSQISEDNSYIDVNFNMGVYGDGGHSEAVSADDFILGFAKNDGNASGAFITAVSKTNGLPLTGGETTLRFNLSIKGIPSGDETIVIGPFGDQSVFSPSGAALTAGRTTGAVKLSPPDPAVISAIMAADNSYIDITFNTGVYGDSQYVNDKMVGVSGVTLGNLRLGLDPNIILGGTASGINVKSIKRADSTVESNAHDLIGGEKTVRIFFDTTGLPSGKETVSLLVESVFNSNGEVYSSETPVSPTKLNPMVLGFGLSELAFNDRYVDINFSDGVYGSKDAVTPVSAADFQLIFSPKGGNCENVTIKSVKQTDSTDETKASELGGGEKKVRFFLNLASPVAGGAETIEIKPAGDQSVYNSAGAAMSADQTTHTINLFASYPDILSAHLATDNSYVDLNFNLGVYGDSGHSAPVTPANFSLVFYSNNGQATAMSISSIRKNDSTAESDATSLIGGETGLRFFLNTTGIPSGVETIRIEPAYGNPVYDSLGQAIPANVIETTGSIHLNAVPKILTAQLSDDMSYVDVYFSTGVYGDSGHSTPVALSNFSLDFNVNSGDVTGVTVSSVRNDSSTDENAVSGALAGGETVLRFFLDIAGTPSGAETIRIKPAGGKSVYAASGNAMASDQATKVINLIAPSPQIVSARLAADDSFIDVTFSEGVYGDIYHTTPVSEYCFNLNFKSNGGDDSTMSIRAIKKVDGTDTQSASALTGGEKTIRIFLYSSDTPSGVETIKITPADGHSVYSYSGKAMASDQATETITMAPYPRIVSAQIAPDNSYIDLNFNTGVYGNDLHTTPISASELNLNFNRNSGSVTNVTIKSVKKNNSVQASDASPLTGGESTVRIFLNTVGASNGSETIIITPIDGSSIFDASGFAMSAYKMTGAVKLNSYTLQIVSTHLADDNSYVDVNFSGGVYGAADGRTPAAYSASIAGSNFVLINALFQGVTISSVKKADSTAESTASPLTGGETTLRFFLNFSRAPGSGDSFEIGPANLFGGLSVYNASGVPMAFSQTTHAIQLNDARPKIVSTQLAGDNSYIDISFNTGVYGDTSHTAPVQPNDFYKVFEANGGNTSGVTLSSIRKTDSTVEKDASPLTGGETTLRVFLSVVGTPTGEETIEILNNGGSIYDDQGNVFTGSTGAVSLNAPIPVIVSSSLGEDNMYIDVNFNTGVYGDTAHKSPLSASSFNLIFNQNAGTALGIFITSVKKNDSVDESHASPLAGGEKTVRLFLYVSVRANGDETFEIKPADSNSIFSFSGGAMDGGQTTGAVKLISNTPEFVSVNMAEGSRYVDVTFNTGVYGNNKLGPVMANNFLLYFTGNGSALSSVSIGSVKKPDSENEALASPLAGGEKTVRLFLTLYYETPDGQTLPGGVPNGNETIALSPYDGDIYGNPGVKIYSRFYMPMVTPQTSGPIKLITPSLDFASVSAPKTEGGYSQYLDVTFNTGAFGDASRLTPISKDDFQLYFNGKSGTAYTAQISSIKKQDSTTEASANPLVGGETRVRFFINNYLTPTGKESIEIKPKENSVFNASGNTMPANRTTGIQMTANARPVIVSSQMGPSNTYIDINFNTGIYRAQGGPVNDQNFQLIFSKNGGTAINVDLYKAAKPDSNDPAKASLLTGGETAVRFFLTVSGIPNGKETIEIKPNLAPISDSNGITMPSDSTTGKIKLLSPYPPSWSNTAQGESLGWMSDVRISAGESHTLVVKNDGSVIAFGNNDDYQCDVPAGLSNVKAVAAGADFSIALKNDGTVEGWGRITLPEDLTGIKAITAGGSAAFFLKDDGTVALVGDNFYKYDYDNDRNYYISQLSIPGGSSSIASISAGRDDHLLVLMSDGTVAAFDYQLGSENYSGQCSVPAGLANVKAVAQGSGYSLALKADGTVAGWGHVGLPVGGLSNAASISAGNSGYQVLKTDGMVSVYDKDGNLEQNSNKDLTGIAAISAGESHYTAVRNDGNVVVWQDNALFYNEGQLSMPQGLNIFQYIMIATLAPDNSYVDITFKNGQDPNSNDLGIYGPSGAPVPLFSSKLKVYITKESQSLFNISVSSLKQAYGSYTESENNYWLTGGETTIRVYLKFTGIPSGTETIEIRPANSFSVFDASGNSLLGMQTTGPIALNRLDSQKNLLYGERADAGWSHGLAVKENGAAFAWGDNTYGQAPNPLNMGNASQVSAGYHHSVALLHNGTVRVWGENYYGQLNMPNGGVLNIMQVSAGGYHTLALTSSGNVIAWGDNFYHQCDVPAGLTGVVQVAAGGHHSLALKSNGTVAAWGDNSFKQSSVPAGLTNVVAIAAGDDYSLALKADGTVVGWGGNSKGQISIPAGLGGVKAIAAGYRHSLAVKSDGTVVAWGDNSKGQCSVPAGLTGVAAVSAGAYFSMAIKEDGSVITWGDDSKGQCSVPESVMPPRIISSTLAKDDSYIDITFNKGVYSLLNGTGPLTAADFMLVFNSADGTATAAAIKLVKKNDNTDENKASALAGGETTVRVFLSVAGNAAGTETIDLKPANGYSIYDMYGSPMQKDQTTGTVTLKKQGQPLPVGVVRSSHMEGAFNWVYVSKDIPDTVFNQKEPASPITDSDSITWQIKMDPDDGSNRMLLVGVYSREANHRSQDVLNVTFNDRDMTYAGSSAIGDVKLDLYYMLDSQLPKLGLEYYVGGRWEASVCYDITVKYKGSNNYLEGRAVLLNNAAQQGPESIITAMGKWEDYRQGTELPTLTDNAMAVDFFGLEGKYQHPDGDLTYSANTAEKAGGVFINWNDFNNYEDWAEIAVSIRNVAYPVTLAAPPSAPAPPAAPDIHQGNNMAFEYKNSVSGTPVQVGSGIAAVSSDTVRTSVDGENWGTANPRPQGEVFSAGGKLLTFSYNNGSTTISTSADGKNWSGVTCRMPEVTDDQKAVYHYEDASITGVAAYRDPTNGSTTYIAVGNAWVAQLNADGSIRRNTNDNPSWLYETSIKFWLTSRDNGATWTASYIPDFWFIKDNAVISNYWPREFKNVICNNNGVFTAYDSQEVYYTLDGVSWIKVKDFTKDAGGNLRNPYWYYITDIFTRNNTIIMTGKGLVTDKLNIFWSTDGTVWTNADITYRDLKFYSYDKYERGYIWTNSNDFFDVTYAHDTFAAKYGNTVAASSNGKDWSLYYCDYGSSGLNVFNDRFYSTVYVNDSGKYSYWLLSSDNLKDWSVENRDYDGDDFTTVGGKAYTTSYNGSRTLLVGYSPLEIDQMSTKDGNTGVPVDSGITLSFTGEIKQGTSYSSITLKDPRGSGVQISVSLDGTNGQLFIKPKSTLDPLMKYTLTIPGGALKDTADSKANQTISIRFTTGTSGGPSVIATSPKNGDESVSADIPVEIDFDRPIAAGPGYGRITIAPCNNGITGTAITIRAGIPEDPDNPGKPGSKLILTPVKPLENGTEYVVTIPAGGIIDQYGQEIQHWSMTFTAGPDITSPMVAGSDPENFGERVKTAGSINVAFDKEVQRGDSFSGIVLKNIRTDSSFDIGVNISADIMPDGTHRSTLTITPMTELALHETYRVSIPAGSVKDMAGNPLAEDYSFVFTEEIMKSYPVLLEAIPADSETNVELGGTIVLTYDRPIKEGSNFVPGQISLADSVRHSMVNFTYSIKGSKLYIFPSTTPKDNPYDALAYGVQYELRIAGKVISDLYGNEDDNMHQFTFTVENQRVVSTNPTSGETSSLLNGCPSVKLDSAFRNSTKGFMFNNIKLEEGGVGGNIIASRTLTDGDTLLIAPLEDLSPNTQYTIEVPRGAVYDSSSLPNNYYTFSFTTGGNSENIKDFTAESPLELGDTLAEGDAVTFDASGCLDGATDFRWDFGDGANAYGALASHTFTYRGEYTVILTMTGPDGKKYVNRRALVISRRPDASSILLDVSPQSPAPLNAGDSADFVITLMSGNSAVKNAPIVITRTYPISENRPPEPLATVTTDENGKAYYKATLPENCPYYYITFKYYDKYNGAEISKEVRRVLKGAVGKVEISGYVRDDHNVVQKNATVLVGTYSVLTDANGYYDITGLDVGKYSMRTSADMHYDDVADVSLTKKSTVRNIVLTKLAPAGNPFVRQIYINRTAAGSGQNFYFLKGIDASIDLSLLVDWNGNDPGYAEFNVAGTIYNEANLRLSLNAGNLKQGDQITVTCVSADGVRSDAFNAHINIIDSLPKEFPYALHPTFIDGKYVIDEYVSLTGIKTPNISSIPVISGGPVSFLTQPAHVTGVMNLDGSFHAFLGRSTDAAAYGYYAQNNMLQKYYAKLNADTDAEVEEISSRQSKSYLGSVSMGGTLDASFYWYYVPSAGGWQYWNGSLHLGINADVFGKESWGIPGTPLSIYLSGEFKVLLDTYLSVAVNNGSFDYSLGTLDLRDLYIEMAGGLDASVVSGSVHFSGDGKVRIQFPSHKTDYYISVKGWANIKALLWSVDIPFLEYSWGDDSPWNTSPSNLKSFSAISPMSPGTKLIPQSTDDFKVMSRDYLDDRSGWISDSSGARGSTAAGGNSKAADGAFANGGTDGSRMLLTYAGNTEVPGILPAGVAATSPSYPGQAADGVSVTTLRSSTFPYTQQNVITYNGGAFMTLVEDDPARTTLNRTRAEYSVYNGTSWSAPQPIDPNNATADFNPVAAATSDGIIAAWENVKYVLPDNAQLKDALAGEEIRVGRYDPATGTWSQLYNLTSDNYLDCTPRIAAAGNRGILVWTRSRSEDYSTLLSGNYSGAYDIIFSKWDGTAFSAPTTIASIGNRPFTGSSLAFDGNKGVYVFSVDEDGDLNTDTDQEIYKMTYDASTGEWSSPVRLTSNTVKDSNPRVCFLNDKAFTVWYQDGKIVYVDNALMSGAAVKIAVDKAQLQDSFTLAVSGNGTVALVGPGTAGSGQEICVVTYDPANDLWGSETAITSDNSYNRSASSAFVNNRLVTVYNRAELVDRTNSADGETYQTLGDSADLRMVTFDLKHDLAVSREGITLSESPSPGSLVTIAARIDNKGMFTEAGVEVDFYYGDPRSGGQKIGHTQVINSNIAPGGSAAAEIKWEVPDSLTVDSIYVVVDPGNKRNDSDRSDNTVSVNILKPDLELVSLTCAQTGGGKYAVRAGVSNIGPMDAPGVVLTLYYTDSSGQMQKVGDPLNAGTLKAGETIDIAFPLWAPDAGLFKDGKADLVATVDVPQGVTESALENNVQTASVQMESLEVISSKPSDKQQNVGVDKPISITFSGDLLQGTDYTNIQLAETTDQGNLPVAAVTDINGDTLIITPVQPLQYSKAYMLKLPKNSVKGVDGAVPSGDIYMTFTTEGSGTYPLIYTLRDIPVGNDITIPFSKPIKSGQKFGDIVFRDLSGHSVPCAVTIQDNLLIIKPDNTLNYSSPYTVDIPFGGLEDSNSNSISSCRLDLTTQANPVQLKSLTLSIGQLSPAFNPDITNYSVKLNERQANVVVNAVPKVADSVVTVNGQKIETGQTATTALTAGANVINVKVSSGGLECIYKIEVDNGTPGSSNGPSTDISPTETTNTVTSATVTISATATIGSSGRVSAAVTMAQISSAVRKAAADAVKIGNGVEPVVEIKVMVPTGANTIETTIPGDAFNEIADNNKVCLKVSTSVASIAFDRNSIVTVSKTAGDVRITAGKADMAALPEETKKVVGNRPVFDFSVSVGDKTITQFGGNVTVSVPYAPKAGEDPDAILIYYINAEGKPEKVSNCHYDQATGSITFITSHFSLYAIGYNKVSFKDVKGSAWYAKAVTFIAARGITSGTGGGNFSPDVKLTRGQFIVMLMRAYGINPDSSPKDNFSDAGNTYYTGYLAAAKRLGISCGIGNNLFAPGKDITRQEMFTLMYNALKTIGALPEGNSGKTLSSFSDAGQIDSWAKDAMILFTKTGTIGGSNGRLAPRDTTTRAEMAQVLYNLLSK